MIKKYFAISVIAASVAIAGCSDDDDPVVDPADPTDPTDPDPDPLPDVTAGEGGSAFDTIFGSADHTTLLAAINSVPDLDKTLDNPESNFTIFAPTNTAFDDLVAADPDDAFAETADLLAPENQDALVRILQYHVIPDDVVSSADLATLFSDGGSVDFTVDTLLADAALTFGATSTDASSGLDVIDSGGVAVGLNDVDLGLTDADTGEENPGVVHSIDAVLIPPAAPVDPDPVDPVDPTPATGTADGVLADTGAYELFRAAMANAFPSGLDGEAWTIFAPSDSVLEAAGITTTDGISLVEHISSQGAFDPVQLATGFAPGGEIAIQSASNNPYVIEVNTSGDTTVNGFQVDLLGTGDGGAQVYSIAGVLTAP